MQNFDDMGEIAYIQSKKNSAQISDITNQYCYKPTPLSFNFEVIEQSVDTVRWLSTDGTVLYGNHYGQLLQSTDEWATKQQVCNSQFSQGIAAVRELNDGELLISTFKNTGVYSKLYKTVGYNKNSPNTCTYKEVLASQSTECSFSNQWGFSIYENIVLASEYGLQGEQGGRRVFLSTDHGDTFDLIFDILTTTIQGRPSEIVAESAHVHTVAYDPYFNRIWVTNGDTPNTGTNYSDDMGQTWTFVTDSENMQYTGIIALPDCVVFGSDRAPNGLHIYRRKDKATMPVIESFYVLDNSSLITQVFQLPYKRDWNPNTPVYFGTFKDTDGKAVIMGFVDSKRAYLMFQAEDSGSFAGDVYSALGNTAQGNVIVSIKVGSEYVTAKSPAPVWNMSRYDKQIVTEAQYNVWKTAELLDPNVEYIVLEEEVV